MLWKCTNALKLQKCSEKLWKCTEMHWKCSENAQMLWKCSTNAKMLWKALKIHWKCSKNALKLQKCTENALKMLRNCKNALKKLWNCSENALKKSYIDRKTFRQRDRSPRSGFPLTHRSSQIENHAWRFTSISVHLVRPIQLTIYSNSAVHSLRNDWRII